MTNSRFHSISPTYHESTAFMVFEQCWEQVCEYVNKNHGKALELKKFTLLNDSTESDVSEAVGEIAAKVLEDNDIKDTKYSIALQRLLLELVCPLSKKHHEIACSMLTPNLMTFEMLSTFMESWIEVNFGMMQHLTNPSYLIENCIMNICYAANVRFDADGLVLLREHLISMLHGMLNDPTSKVYIHHYLYKAQKREMLSEFIHTQNFRNTLKEMGISIMGNTPVEATMDGGVFPIITEYLKLTGGKVFREENLQINIFYKAIKRVLVYNPYNCFAYVDYKFKGKKLNKHTVPFGFLGLVSNSALLSLILLLGKDSDVRGFTITELSESSDLCNQAYCSLLFENCRKSGFLPYLSRNDLIKYLLPKHISVYAHAIKTKINNTENIINYLLDYEVFVCGDGSLKASRITTNLPKKQIVLTSKFYLDESNKLYS